MSTHLVLPARTRTVPAVRAVPQLRSVVIVAPLVVVTFVTRASPAVWPAIAAITVTVVAADIDRRTHRLPDRLLLVAATPLVVAACAAVALGSDEPVRAMVTGGVVMAGPVLALHVASPDGMGFGDVKAAAVLGAAVGSVQPALGIVALAIASAIAVAWAAIGRRPRVAFGPALVVGALAALVVAVSGGVEVTSWQ